MIGHNNPPLGEGWIARHRSVRDHWLVGHGIHVKPADETRKHCSTQGEAWEDLLMECRYEDGTVSNGGKKMELRRGELVGAVSWLAHRWNWTPKTVRRFLDQLENDGMIELRNPASEKGNQVGRQANVITVCNYEAYQNSYEAKGKPKGQPEDNQRATTGRPEGNIYKDNKGTKEQRNKETSVNDLGKLNEQLLEACNGALDNPVNCSGLLSMAIPQMWMAEGCDLQMDILPTLKAVGQKAHGKRIQTWNYFTKAIGDAKRNREKGLITFNEIGEIETKAERLRRMAVDIEQEHRK